ncbi:MAG TPA: pentapeptide repeat-containing protein [Ktedonobacterales bacterium]|nr:pentapeptide repeat-containing protein [Ktedonobacterales bacterium]
MSDEPTPADAPQAKTGIAWGDPIDEARKQELWAQLRAWWEEIGHGERVGPFAGKSLTGADVFSLSVCAMTEATTRTEVEAEHWLRTAQEDDFSPKLSQLCLQSAVLNQAQLQGAVLSHAQMQGVDLREAQLQGANLFEARLEQANFRKARLQRAFLRRATLVGANLREAQLAGANLREAVLSEATSLRDAVLSSPEAERPQVADVCWGGVNLATLKEPVTPPLGDEQIARQWRTTSGDAKSTHGEPTRADRQRYKQGAERSGLFRVAVRANRQLAVALQTQGLDEEAARFAYRAQVCQRTVYRLEGWRSFGRYVFSGFLDGLAGYGYRPARTLFWYLVVVLGFAFAYWHVGPGQGIPLSPLGSLVFSVTSFHGRGFFPGGSPGHSLTLDDPLTVLAAAEAVVGLLIEISFIATFTQRFFGSK